MKTAEEVMEILEAFDATGSQRAAGELVGCDHKTVGDWVHARDDVGGGVPVRARARPHVDAFAAKIDKWVDRSRGKLRAGIAHQKLVAMGYVGSERTTRRGVAAQFRSRRPMRSARMGAPAEFEALSPPPIEAITPTMIKLETT